MLFNSHIFMLLFLPLLLAGWYFLNWKKKFQLAQGYLIGMSLWFYAYANLQYLWLLLFSCLIGWLLSCVPEKISSEKGKKVLTGVGCVFHLGLLGYFKYSNFFLENLNTVFHTDFPMLQILLPVGISFYTFQQLAYLIDRCRGDAPRDSFFDYLTFMVYFPQLLQGPILLRSEFMGQLKEPERRRFHAERFSEGIQFFVFGLAKKVLLALAEQVSSRLRKSNQLAQSVTVEIKYSTFQRTSHQKVLLFPTNSTQPIYELSCRLFDELWNHTPIRLLGIRTGKLLDEDAPVQMTLFDSGYLEAKSEKQQKLDAALDQIKSRYGENAVIRGSFFPEKEEP